VTGGVEVHSAGDDAAWVFRVGSGHVSRRYDALYKAVTAGRAETRRRVEVLIGTPDNKVQEPSGDEADESVR